MHNHFSTVKFPQQVDPGAQAMDRAPAQYDLHFRPALSMDAIGLHLRLGQPLLFGRGQRIRHQTRCGDPHRTTRYHLALVHTASRLDGRGHTDKLSSIFTHNIPKIPGFVQGHAVLQPKIVNRIELSNRPGNNDSGRFCIFLTVSAKFRPDSVRILSRPRTGQDSISLPRGPTLIGTACTINYS